MAEILDQEVPALEIVEERHAGFSIQTSQTSKPNVDRKPVERAMKTEDGRFVVPPQLAKAAMSRRHRSSRPVAVSDQDQGNVAAAADSSRSRHDRHRRRRSDKSFAKHRRERSTVLDVVMVILGGCLSVPVAQLLVWWLIGADPLGLAPHTAKFAPILVPAELRGLEDVDSDQATGEDEESDAAAPTSRDHSRVDSNSSTGATGPANPSSALPNDPGNLS